MNFYDTKFWKNYPKFDKIVGNSSMRSFADAVIYWKLFKEFNFNNVLEIGVFQGSTSALILEANKNSIVTAIDPIDHLDLFRELYPEYKSRFYFMNCKSEEASIASDEKFDFILVDGNHQYINVKHDATMAFKYCSTNSIIAFDDYKLDGVKETLLELKLLQPDWVPFLRTEQTEFWHHKSVDRGNFLDNLLIDSLTNYIFAYNVTDENSNTILETKTLYALSNDYNLFDQLLKKYD